MNEKFLTKKEFSTEELVNRLKSMNERIFKTYNVDFSYLGGSWATKTNHWWSDIDIFLSIPNYLSLPSKEKIDLLLELTNEFERITESSKIQISILEALPLHIQFSVIKEGILIYERIEVIRLDFIENMLNYYYDHIIWYDRMIDESLGINKR